MPHVRLRVNNPTPSIQHTRVVVAILTWRKVMMPERIFEFARVSLDLGYDVEIIVCDDYPTMRYGDPYQPARCGVVQKLISIIDSINVKADGSHSYTYDDCKDGRRTLLVVAYIGHGGKWDITTPTEPDSKTVLLGGHPNTKNFVPITYIQQYCRDKVGLCDVFFLSEMCYGDFDGLDPNTYGNQASWKAMQTMAAGRGLVRGRFMNSHLDFIGRLVDNMRSDRRQLTIKERQQAVAQPNDPHSPGDYHRRDDTSASQDILLGPMPG